MAPLGAQGWGSSPLTRGKHAVTLDRVTLTRLIPAHAGKTSAATTPTPAHPAHPRSRGENLQVRDRACKQHGSSPLTRGKRDRIGSSRYEEGLIPAHAGKTVSMSAVTLIV